MANLASLYADPNQRARLPAGMRNNNPGNIKFVPNLRYAGVVGPSVNTDQGDPQAVFDTPEHGMAAMYGLALKKYQGGKRSANDLIAGNMGWTPGNFQAAANVAQAAGVDPNADLNLSDPAAAARFMRGLMRQEHGNASDAYSDAMIGSAISGWGGAPAQPFARVPGGPAMMTGARTMAPAAPAAPGQQAPAAPVLDGLTPAQAELLASATNPLGDAFGSMGAAPQAQQPDASMLASMFTPEGPSAASAVPKAALALASSVAAPDAPPSALGQLGDMLLRQKQQLAVAQQPRQAPATPGAPPPASGLSQMFVAG